MAKLTLRVLDGPDRGKTFSDLDTPISIGREEGNTIQLNDDRVSRFHLKIQEDDDRVVLTDLQSTNGTKVNGENVQLWPLRFGDMIAVGRTLLLTGSREQIAARLAEMRGVNLADGVALGEDDYELDSQVQSLSLDDELFGKLDDEALSILHTLRPPKTPEGLSPGQAAQLAELLQYLHFRLRGLISSVEIVPKSDRVTLDPRQWQNALDIFDRLAGYVSDLGGPPRE